MNKKLLAKNISKLVQKIECVKSNNFKLEEGDQEIYEEFKLRKDNSKYKDSKDFYLRVFLLPRLKEIVRVYAHFESGAYSKIDYGELKNLEVEF